MLYSDSPNVFVLYKVDWLLQLQQGDIELNGSHLRLIAVAVVDVEAELLDSGPVLEAFFHFDIVVTCIIVIIINMFMISSRPYLESR